MTHFPAHLLGGIIILICGLLVKRFPMLIAGYNTMPAKKRKNVDIEGLSSFMSRHLCIIGALWIAFYAAFHLMGEMKALPIVYMIYLPIYLIWMLVRAQRFDHNK